MALAFYALIAGQAWSASAPDEVWFEYGLASVLTGRSSTGVALGEKIFLVAVGPVERPSADIEARVRAFNGREVPRLGAQLADLLDAQVAALPDRVATSTATTKSQAIAPSALALAGEVGQAIRQTAAQYHTDLVRVFSASNQGLSGYRLLLVNRYCDPTRSQCELSSFASGQPNRSTARFGMVAEWLTPNLVNEVNSFVNLDGNAPTSAVNIAEATEAMWTALPDAESRVRLLENAIERARKTGIPLQYVVPALVGIGQSAAVRFVDVLGDPAEAFARVPPEQGPALTRISDELARMRVLDCSRLRGKLAPAEVLQCAGYQGDESAVAQCLAGKQCLPAFGASPVADVALITATGSIASLVEASHAPRLALGSIDDVERIARQCARDHSATATSVSALCMIRARSGAAEAAIMDCLASHSYDARGAMACLGRQRLPAELSAKLECIRRSQGDPVGLALCSGQKLMPAGAAEIVRCASASAGGSAQEVAECLALDRTSPDFQKAVGCVQRSRGDWKSAAICAAGNRMPPEVSQALDCASHSTSAASLGTCMAANKLPGDLGKAAQCYAGSGGSPAGMAVCMVGDGLTPDQRIALQCAASSGGVPATWAVCTGGQLAWKEFNNCKGKRAFEDECFGKGNELRKFVEAFGVKVGPNSVVGNLLTTQIRIYQTYSDVAQEIFTNPAAVVQQAGGVLQRTGDFVKDPGTKARKCIENLWAASSSPFAEARTPLPTEDRLSDALRLTTEGWN